MLATEKISYFELNCSRLRSNLFEVPEKAIDVYGADHEPHHLFNTNPDMKQDN